MNRILTHFYNEATDHLFQVLLQQYQDTNRFHHDFEDEFFTIIKKNEYSFLIVEFESPYSEKIIEFWQSSQPARQLIICTQPENYKRAQRVYKSDSLIHYHNLEQSLEDFQLLVEKKLSSVKDLNKKTEYCKVPLEFFKPESELFCDVYIKLGDSKFVKVIQRFSRFENNDLLKFREKDIKHFYVKDKDFKIITKKLATIMNSGSHAEGALIALNDQVDVSIPLALQQTVAESINKLGLNEDALEITSVAISSSLEMIQKSDDLGGLIQNALKNVSYISEHSFITSFVASAILKELGEDNIANLQAISIAAFFHDLALESDEEAKVQSLESRKFFIFGIEEQNLIQAHPLKAKSMLAKVAGLPKEALQIVEQHHERYDGGGFPYGLSHTEIAPLSTVFLVAHEFTHLSYNSGFSPVHIEAILEDMITKYKKGYFKVVTKALAAIVQLGDDDNEIAQVS
ncbi:MAG: HD domain-containing protein [Oligoflexia bacterium]|nr:HD domain-containing protein [Oligoflexia bacterium]